MIELWRSDRSQQNCVSSETGVERASRQWLASLLDRLAAGRVLFEMKVMAVSPCDLAQDTHGLFSHFRPHAVTRKDHYIEIHGLLETRPSGGIALLILTRLLGGPIRFRPSRSWLLAAPQSQTRLAKADPVRKFASCDLPNP